jgi:large subunit ribosomal protein L24
MAVKKAAKKIEKLDSSLRRGDPVMVIAGGNKNKRPLKGQVSKIKAIVGEKSDRVILDGLNLYVRHKRAQGPGQEGGKVQVELPVHISNVMYYVEKLKKPVRLVSGLTAEGKRVRGYKDPETKEFVELQA